MIFWIVAIVLTVGALALLLRPLLAAGSDADTGAVDAADHDIAVYRSQLEELSRDHEARRLSEEEAEAARVEIGRRLIAADDRRAKAARGGSGIPKALTGGLAVVLVAGVAFGTYFATGMPGVPDRPLASRTAERDAARAQSNQAARSDAARGDQSVPGTLSDAAAGLRKRLEADGGDLDGWLLLGRTELMSENYPAAAQAFEKAQTFAPDDMSVRSALGEALVLWANGEVTDRAQKIFREVVAVLPNDPRARFYLAEAKMQAGDPKGAMEAFIALSNDSPADAPWQQALRARAEGLAGELGIDISDKLAAAKSGPPPLPPSLDNLRGDTPRGPTAEQMAEAENLAPEDRQDMIRGMVDGLAARLEENPMDFQGWMRLIRSRMVLGELGRAQQAFDRALELFDGAPVPKRMLAQAADEFGLKLPDDFELPEMPAGAPSADAQTSDAPRGPSEEDVAAAQEMSPEDRQAMIAAMVSGLSDRLENETPDDVEGWMRLARSYDVLRREDDALEALVSATAAAERTNHPELEAILIDQGRLRRSIAGNAQTPESIALMRQVEAMNPDNVEALWFLGLDAVRVNDRDKAKDYFERALAGLPENAPERDALVREVDRLLGQGSE